jgi:hypothetical protein
MLDTIENFGLTTVMVIIGPLLLGLAMAYGIWAYRRRSRGMKQQTEASTVELYQQAADRERRVEGENPGPLPH